MRPFAALLLLAATSAAAQAQQFQSTEQARIEVSTIAEGLDHPWGVAPLPDGSLLVTERSGALRRVGGNGTLGKPIDGVPEVDARDQRVHQIGARPA